MIDLQQFDPTDRARIEAMVIGGELLGSVRDSLRALATVGTTFESLEAHAQRLIRGGGAQPSFSTVPGYHWATCIMKNDALCHGIPRNGVVAAGDVMTIDVGLIYQGFHTDATVSFVVEPVSEKMKHFLQIGRESLADAISAVQPNGTVFAISSAMESRVKRAGYGLVVELTGHGVGQDLHMEPNIPCIAYNHDKRIKLSVGQTIAVEVMYTMGSPALTVDADGWTFRTKDHSLTGMFEDTVLVTPTGFEVLTKPSVTGIL